MSYRQYQVTSKIKVAGNNSQHTPVIPMRSVGLSHRESFVEAENEGPELTE